MFTTTPTVFIIDEDPAVRHSLTALIVAAGWRAERYASTDAFLAHPPVQGPSCLLLEIARCGFDGLALQRRLAMHLRDMPIIIITGHGDIPMTVQAMKAGAIALLMKPLESDMVLSAVREAIERSREVRQHEAEVHQLRTRYNTLSLREREVMSLVVAGLLNKQVGGRLGISEITVKAHRGRVMRKLAADSLPELVRMAASLCLVSPASSRADEPWMRGSFEQSKAVSRAPVDSREYALAVG